ncbi:S-methyl-5'-thioinosine phosphorylase [Methanosarcinaceae archaeon Ag5]|uniref:Probable S-methyl-5'-thioinosine phosphorylase n=1 Tax=Methanolapillus africanus TaxID=3028297 RepID=A0AAE4MIJ1_9EURY|nr:S-methyl-5'-thioinosine phosphorylase [Methanosarcinaceae archaeon Ag5]
MSFKRVALTLICGVGYNMSSSDAMPIQTKYGSVNAYVLNFESMDVALIPRHQGKRHVPPHQINYKALVSAAQKIGAPVLSINSVGSMKPELAAGSFFVPNDFIDMTKFRETTFFDKKAVHTDMSDPYCQNIRKALTHVLAEQGISFSEGVYVCTEGPRFETKAEIRMYAQFSDVVGMTGVPEVVLAKEAGLCYASLCLITNPAAGLSSNVLTIDEVQDAVSDCQGQVFDIVLGLAKNLKNQTETDCFCKDSVQNSEI